MLPRKLLLSGKAPILPWEEALLIQKHLGRRTTKMSRGSNKNSWLYSIINKTYSHRCSKFMQICLIYGTKQIYTYKKIYI